MFNFNSVVRNTGRTYKSIYANGSRLNDKDTKALRNKFINIEKKVYKFGQSSVGYDPRQDLSIVFHSDTRYSYQGRVHLEFDEKYPLIHLISYNTEVATYNIETGRQYTGNTYSPTTTRQMGDFSCLFDLEPKAKVDTYTGIIRNFVIVKRGHTPILDLAKDSMTMNLVDTLAQCPVFDKFFMKIDSYKGKCFKYQKQQMTFLFVDWLSQINRLLHSDFDVYDTIVRNGLSKRECLSILNQFYTELDTLNTPRINKVISNIDINRQFISTYTSRERNLGKSINIEKKIIKDMLSTEKVASRE